ncbi:MAG: ATP phosphoribosyltransferase regulatory subunit [Gammaproteobacteria bacterium]|nr:MAG: ATP phosphoribosyltransferase regulatory subunit [Gammaproteobacteria bacterium]
MSSDDRWLLPEGIDEALPEQARALEQMRRQILDLYASWGYELVMPPFIEFLESLLTGTGHDLDLQTFKLTDQLSGRMMGIRADMTPQVARIDAHRLGREAPTRLCYMGTVLHTRPAQLGGSRSPLQIGAELYGHSGLDSDFEVLSLMLETFRLCGIGRIHLDLGHVGIYRALARSAGWDEERELEFFDMLQRKARTEIDDFLAGQSIDAALRKALSALIDLNGGVEVLNEARRLLGGMDGIPAAIDSLEAISRRLSECYPDVAVNHDLAELRGYHYHTGLVFAAYVPGQGREIARGGRYDDIGRVFGRARPATGFSTDLKTLWLLGGHARTEPRCCILAPAEGPGLDEAVATLRAEGRCVVRALEGQQAGAGEMGCTHELRLEDGAWQVVPVA